MRTDKKKKSQENDSFWKRVTPLQPIILLCWRLSLWFLQGMAKKNTPFLFFEYLENGESDRQTDFFRGFGSKFVIQRYKIF